VRPNYVGLLAGTTTCHCLFSNSCRSALNLLLCVRLQCAVFCWHTYGALGGAGTYGCLVLVAVLCSAADAASNKRMSVQQLRRRASLPMMDRPAQLQGYGQLLVDMPVDAHYPTIQEVRALLAVTNKQALMHTTQPCRRRGPCQQWLLNMVMPHP
jgi:hypothetical protein